METPRNQSVGMSASEAACLIMENSEDEDDSSLKPADDKEPEGNGDPPSLRSIAKELKRSAIDRHGYRESDEEDEDFEAFPIVKTGAVVAGEEGVGVPEGQGRQPGPRRRQKSQEELAKSQEDFRRELFQILKEYFKAAFTIIVKRRRLCPSSGFQTVRVLGVKVPRFLHPSSLEYVQEVSEKLLLFLNRNTTDGCAIHIMIEKNKTLHVVQRFVFKTFGTIDALGSIKRDSENRCCIEDLKTHCRASLLQITTSDKIKPVLLPQFSRWSISIGLKKEFVCMDMKAFKELWDLDPSGSYFPWKERPKSLASAGVSVKIDLSNAGLDISKYVKSATSINEESASRTNSDYSRLRQCVKENQTEEQNLTNGESSRKEPANQNTAPEDAESRNENDMTRVMESGIVCFPVSSFPICEGLMLCLYGLQYPTPTKNVVSSSSNSVTSSVSPFSIKSHRSSRNNTPYRLSQIRNNKSSNSKHAL